MAQLRIEIEPGDALVDEAVSLRVLGCPPGPPVSVRARMADYLGRAWESRATFRADAHGCVDLGTTRPEAGSYDAVDAMGLFWSMAAEAEPAAALVDSATSLELRIDAEASTGASASAVGRRRFAAAGVTRAEVRDTTPGRRVSRSPQDTGIVGTLFRPPGVGPYPAVIVLGGSSGDVWEAHAARLDFAFGGSPAAEAAARADAWPRVIAWLRRLR